MRHSLLKLQPYVAIRHRFQARIVPRIARRARRRRKRRKRRTSGRLKIQETQLIHPTHRISSQSLDLLLRTLLHPFHDLKSGNVNLGNSQLSLTTMSPDKNLKENLKNASLNGPKISELPDHMSVTKIDTSPSSAGPSLLTDVLRERMMSIDV
jgi:hypothetical protein